jgi:hypothetical protein
MLRRAWLARQTCAALGRGTEGPAQGLSAKVHKGEG